MNMKKTEKARQSQCLVCSHLRPFKHRDIDFEFNIHLCCDLPDPELQPCAIASTTALFGKDRAQELSSSTTWSHKLQVTSAPRKARFSRLVLA